MRTRERCSSDSCSKRLAFAPPRDLRQSCTPGEPQKPHSLSSAAGDAIDAPMAALEEAFGDVIQRQITDDASFDKWKGSSARRREIVAFVDAFK